MCFISFYIILWVIILLFFAKYLSLHRDIQPFAEYAVTPCMGVWIETAISSLSTAKVTVTPCMGVWIETSFLERKEAILRSHPVWVCGLKHSGISVTLILNSHTLYGCVD